MDVPTFIDVVMTLRMRHMFSVTSWLRTPKRNKMVGGHPNSRH